MPSLQEVRIFRIIATFGQLREAAHWRIFPNVSALTGINDLQHLHGAHPTVTLIASVARLIHSVNVCPFPAAHKNLQFTRNHISSYDYVGLAVSLRQCSKPRCLRKPSTICRTRRCYRRRLDCWSHRTDREGYGYATGYRSEHKQALYGQQTLAQRSKRYHRNSP